MGHSNNKTCALPGCSAPVWVGDDGQPSAYCSRSHLNAAKSPQKRGGASQMPMCKNCHQQRVYVENGKMHEFCGRGCANEYRQRAGIDGFASQATGPVEMCLLCHQYPKARMGAALSDFCSEVCKNRTYSSGPTILEIPRSDEEFKDISALFIEKWKHPAMPNKPMPGPVVKLYKIYSREQHMKRFRAYKSRVGNPRRRWHGTTRACRIGDDPANSGFCSTQGCSMCGILQNSFMLAKAGKAGPSSYQRFGQGIYSSATSSKAYDYINNSGNSPYRAMFLCEVIMGKVWKPPQEDHTLTKPPPGYDSVVGEPGLTVNYDEAVVYTNDAIRPEYLVIFEPSE